MKRTLLTLLLLGLLTLPALAQQNKKEPNTKIGAFHYTHSGAQYPLSDSTSSSTASDDLIGAGFFYERVFLSRFSAGLKYSSLLDRSLVQTVGGQTVTTVEQTALASFDFKAFFKDHSSNGFKGFLGVGFGSYTPKSTVTTIAASGNTEGNTGAAVPISSLSVGFDYLLDFGGVRVEAYSITGSRRDLTGHPSYTANYRYDGSAFEVGVFSFF